MSLGKNLIIMKRVFKEIVTNFCSQCTNVIMYFKWFVATLKLHDWGKKEKNQRKRGRKILINSFPSLNVTYRVGN